MKTRTLLQWVRQGKIKGYKLSGTKRHVWRFQRADLDAALFGEANTYRSRTKRSPRIEFTALPLSIPPHC